MGKKKEKFGKALTLTPREEAEPMVNMVEQLAGVHL